MPYARRYTRRSKAATNKKILTRRPTANNQKYQLLSLNKKVNRLSRKASNISERVFYQSKADSTLSANYVSYPLVTPYSGWHNVFGESDNVLESRKINISKLNLAKTMKSLSHLH